jgi:putative PIN family toxin of toxin-antitoxin system
VILVIDSGVWISAFQFNGTPLLTVEQALVHHQIASCEPIHREIRSALVKKFGWSHGEVDEVFTAYLSRAMAVAITGNLFGVCRDAKDDMVLECAMAANASVLVSGDKDLLTLNNYRNIRILTPREFLREFAARPKA